MASRLTLIARIAAQASIALGAVVLLLTGIWLAKESEWAAWEPKAPEDAFRHGTLGLEFAPLKYVLVMDEVSKDAFATRIGDAKPWPEAYGFIANPEAAGDDLKVCEENADKVLPVGFSVSRYLPISAATTPVKFVGLTCAACHSSQLRTPDGQRREVVFGAGNASLDIIAWTDGFRNAILDPRLTVDKIFDAYEARCGRPSGLWGRTVGRWIERGIIGEWLSSGREAVFSATAKYDLPYVGPELKNAAAIPAGPGRTRPFRSIVRVALDLPGAESYALSKIPAVFEQRKELRPRSQYDGSIGDLVTRGFVAIYASGGSVEALSKPEIVDNLRAAVGYTKDLGIATGVPDYQSMFPEPQYRIDTARADAGFDVYMNYCNRCHGHRPRDGGAWSLEGAGEIHEISFIHPPDGSPGIGVDSARVEFRHAEKLPVAIWVSVPGYGDDLAAQRDELEDRIEAAAQAGRAGDAALWTRLLKRLNLASRKHRTGHPFSFPLSTFYTDVGYINNPIPLTYLRAPYLHNASVPTLRQLINLDERPSYFCRGNNVYDPVSVGIVAPEVGEDDPCPPEYPFKFDTTQLGNSNAGHDFPWPYDPNRDEEQKESLRNLLEYLKTL